MFSLKEFSSLNGVRFSIPKLTLNYVDDLVRSANRGDKSSAFALLRVARTTSPSHTVPVEAHVSFGAGANGVVTVTSDVAWAEGNNFTVKVAIAAGANAALAASLVGKDITVTLGTTSDAGVADAAKNTALLVIGAINGIVGKSFTATKSGSGATAISTIVAKTNFIGGVDEVLSNEKKAWDIATTAVAGLFA